jgi:hypothetical protein
MDAYCLRQQSVIVVYMERYVRTLGSKARYIPHWSLVISYSYLLEHMDKTATWIFCTRIIESKVYNKKTVYIHNKRQKCYI